MLENQFYDDYQSPLGYRALKNGYDTYGVDHSKFTTREEVEYQDKRIKREEELMQQQRNMGITGNYMQYGTNFWNTSPENNYGFGGSEVSKNSYTNSLEEKQNAIPPLNQYTTDMPPNSELSNIITQNQSDWDKTYLQCNNQFVQKNPLQKEYINAYYSNNLAHPYKSNQFNTNPNSLYQSSNSLDYLKQSFGINDTYKQTTFNRNQLNNLTEEELRNEFEKAFPILQRIEGYVGHPYLDTACKDTSGTGHLMDMKNLQNEKSIDFSNEENRIAYTNLSNKMKKNFCKIDPDGNLTTNVKVQRQTEVYPELARFVVDEATDKEVAYKHFKERFKQLREAMNAQNPPIIWKDLNDDLKYPFWDVLYNPGRNTPVWNWKTKKTGWPNLMESYSKKDYEWAKNEVKRKDLNARTSDLQKKIDAGVNALIINQQNY